MSKRSKKKKEKIEDIQYSMLKEFDNTEKEFDNILKDLKKMDESIDNFKLENFDEVQNEVKSIFDRAKNTLGKANKSVGSLPLNDETKKLFKGSCKIEEFLKSVSKSLEIRGKIEGLFNIYQIAPLFNKYSFLYLIQEYNEMIEIIKLILTDSNGKKIKEIVDEKLLDNGWCLSTADGLLSREEIKMILNENEKEVIDQIIISCYKKNKKKLLKVVDENFKKIEVLNIINNDMESSKIINEMYTVLKEMIKYSVYDDHYFKNKRILLDGLNHQVLNCELLVRHKVNYPKNIPKWDMKRHFERLMKKNCGKDYRGTHLFRYFEEKVYASVYIEEVEGSENNVKGTKLTSDLPQRNAIGHGLSLMNKFSRKGLINIILFVSNIINLNNLPQDNMKS